MTRWPVASARSERGASAVEYALIITGVAVTMLAVVGFFQGAVAEMWEDVIAVM
ncbi:Flp family type IVb pilin [Aeromicrobium duanguangcaii]|uniref:Flp family type IVb pilin n=1 Tax=Aeromicrobium duanguangcaii TaxID=2968086 RepID=UPI002018299D|nr:Flp family type IVb pilin [Aeromicrobium duanguangcaii]MCL3838778.1 Flp family type IVb pilin [Aeromicrobium duanguangcaii]